MKFKLLYNRKISRGYHIYYRFVILIHVSKFAMKGILNYIRISVCKCGVNNSMFDTYSGAYPFTFRQLIRV